MMKVDNYMIEELKDENEMLKIQIHSLQELEVENDRLGAINSRLKQEMKELQDTMELGHF